MSLGKRLKDARVAAGLTQRQLAQLCGWGGDKGQDAQSRIAHYEGGRNEPTIGVIEQIATILHVDPCELAFGPQHYNAEEMRVLSAYRGADARGRYFIEAACRSATHTSANARGAKRKPSKGGL